MVDKSKVSASAIKSSVTTYLVQMLLQLFLLKGLHPSHWTQSVRLHGELLADLLHEGDVSQVEQGALGETISLGKPEYSSLFIPFSYHKATGWFRCIDKMLVLITQTKKQHSSSDR